MRAQINFQEKSYERRIHRTRISRDVLCCSLSVYLFVSVVDFMTTFKKTLGNLNLCFS